MFAHIACILRQVLLLSLVGVGTCISPSARSSHRAEIQSSRLWCLQDLDLKGSY